MDISVVEKENREEEKKESISEKAHKLWEKMKTQKFLIFYVTAICYMAYNI